MNRLHHALGHLVLTVLLSAPLAAHDDTSPKPDRGPKNTGSVLVFSGTGWYRHPETAAISGWLARLSNELGMQVDVTESPRDITQLLDRYDVLILNNSNELVQLFDEKQRQKVEDWYKAGGGIVALHAALVRQTEWEWFTKLARTSLQQHSCNALIMQEIGWLKAAIWSSPFLALLRKRGRVEVGGHFH